MSLLAHEKKLKKINNKAVKQRLVLAGPGYSLTAVNEEERVHANAVWLLRTIAGTTPSPDNEVQQLKKLGGIGGVRHVCLLCREQIRKSMKKEQAGPAPAAAKGAPAYKSRADLVDEVAQVQVAMAATVATAAKAVVSAERQLRMRVVVAQAGLSTDATGKVIGTRRSGLIGTEGDWDPRTVKRKAELVANLAEEVMGVAPGENDKVDKAMATALGFGTTCKPDQQRQAAITVQPSARQDQATAEAGIGQSRDAKRGTKRKGWADEHPSVKPMPESVMPEGVEHGRGVFVEPQEAYQMYVDKNANKSWFPAGKRRCFVAINSTDGASCRKRKELSLVLSSTKFANETTCSARETLPVFAILCAENKKNMVPVLRWWGDKLAKVTTLTYRNGDGPDEEIPVVHPQTNDEKMMKLEKCFGGDSCTKCCGACTILKKNLDQFKHRPGTDPAKLGKTRVLHDEVCAAAGHPAYTITLAGPTGCVCTGHLGDLQEDEFAAPVGAVGAAALPGWHSESPKHAEMKAKANGEGGDRHSAYGRLCFRDLEEENYVMDTMHAAIHMRKDVCELLVDGALQFDLQQETLEELVDNGKGVTTVLIGTVTVPELQAGAHEPGKMCGPESKFFLAIFERIFTRWKLAKPHDADLDAFITCLRRGKKALNDVLDLLLSRNTEAAFGLSLHTRLKAKAEAFANWLLDDVQTRRSQHGAYIPGGIKSGNVRCKQAVHNLVTHFVDLALHWWTEYGILIGVFSNEGSEHLNLFTGNHLCSHNNGHYHTVMDKQGVLRDNMLSNMFHHLWDRLVSLEPKEKRAKVSCRECSTTDHTVYHVYSARRCPKHPEFRLVFAEDIDADYNEFFGGEEEANRLAEDFGKKNLHKYFRAGENPEV